GELHDDEENRHCSAHNLLRRRVDGPRLPRARPTRRSQKALHPPPPFKRSRARSPLVPPPLSPVHDGCRPVSSLDRRPLSVPKRFPSGMITQDFLVTLRCALCPCFASASKRLLVSHVWTHGRFLGGVLCKGPSEVLGRPVFCSSSQSSSFFQPKLRHSAMQLCRGVTHSWGPAGPRT